MNVLVGIHEGGFNGIDAYAEQVAGALVAAGESVTLLTATEQVADASRARLADDRVEIVNVGLARPGRFIETTQRLWHGVRMARLGEALEQALVQLDRHFDVIHLNHPGLAEAARPWGERVVVAAWFYPHALVGRLRETWRHTRGGVLRRPILTAKSLAFYRSDEAGYRAADVVLAPTQTLADQLSAQGKKAVVCPPPVRLAHADPTAAGEAGRSGESVRQGARRLLACGGDLSHPRKNFADAIRAARLLPESLGPIELTLVGGRAEALQSLASDLPAHVRVEFPGRMQPAKLHALMAAADVFVMPSLYEEWGYVVVEALLSGTSVAAYPVHPFPDMLAGELGAIAAARTPAALAHALERCLTTPPPADLAQRAADRFGSEAIGDRLRAIYRGAVADHAAADPAASPTPQEVA